MESDRTRSNLKYILSVLEEMDDMNEDRSVSHILAPQSIAAGSTDDIGDDIGDVVEKALRCALDCFLFAHDSRLLSRHLETIARCVEAFPEDVLRPLLNRSSPDIDALIPHTDLWGNPGAGMLFDEVGSSLSVGAAPRFFVTPFLAFLLAGTEFPFTPEELNGIRSGWGESVADIRRVCRRENGKSGIVYGKGDGE